VLPAVLSLPVLAWLCGYSFAKRFTSAAHLWLGFALALSPICAWVALRGETLIAQPQDILPAILLGGAIALWVSGFDIIYACQDADFDRGAKLHSVPAKFGVVGALRIAALLHLGMWTVLLLLPSLVPQLKLASLYYLACGVVAVLLARQHLIVSAKDLSRVNEAFFTLNAIISFGFTSIAAVDTLMG
jgi:4-hydroxybenzoate polyprenyltransferase